MSNQQLIRIVLIVEAAIFALAALAHFGVIASGYEHQRAGIAESVIGAVLLLGAGVSLIWPELTRVAGLAVQGFALLGTLVGVVMVIIGVGPQTTPDIIYHVILVAGLVTGLVLTAREHHAEA